MTEVFNRKCYDDSLTDFGMVMMNYFGDEEVYYGGVHMDKLLDIMFDELSLANMLHLLSIIANSSNEYLTIQWLSSDDTGFKSVWRQFWLLRKMKFITIEEIHRWMFDNGKHDTMCRMNRQGAIGEIIVERHSQRKLGRNVLFNRRKYIPNGVYPY